MRELRPVDVEEDYNYSVAVLYIAVMIKVLVCVNYAVLMWMRITTTV